MRNIMIFLLAGIFLSINSYADLVDPTQPTQPTFSSNTEEGGLQLNAIIYSPKRPIAIIGGNIVKLNDVVDGYKVTEIQKQFVTLTASSGEVKTLKIDPLDVKKPHQI
jgi:hypothetical protein